MKDTYRYVIHAYEDARQRRPIKHQHGGTTVLTDGAGALERAKTLRSEPLNVLNQNFRSR